MRMQTIGLLSGVFRCGQESAAAPGRKVSVKNRCFLVPLRFDMVENVRIVYSFLFSTSMTTLNDELTPPMRNHKINLVQKDPIETRSTREVEMVQLAEGTRIKLTEIDPPRPPTFMFPSEGVVRSPIQIFFRSRIFICVQLVRT
jgi:hypothetical protein